MPINKIICTFQNFEYKSSVYYGTLCRKELDRSRYIVRITYLLFSIFIFFKESILQSNM